MQGQRGVELRGECLWADGRRTDARVFASICRALAVACMENEIKRVLIDATDSDPDGVQAVRDAFTVMVLAGVPPGFRVALVVNVPQVRGFFVNVQRDLAQLRIEAKVFDQVEPAADWLACPRASVKTDTRVPAQ